RGGRASSAPAARTHRGETQGTNPGRREGTPHHLPPGHPRRHQAPQNTRPPPGQPHPWQGAAWPRHAAMGGAAPGARSRPTAAKEGGQGGTMSCRVSLPACPQSGPPSVVPPPPPVPPGVPSSVPPQCYLVSPPPPPTHLPRGHHP
ncbi:unnamed protein product, partial [Bubo scandiacus]